MKQTIYHIAKKLFRLCVYTLLPLVGGGWVGVSCTDTWDDHYEGTVTGVNDGTLWEAIQSNPELSNFAHVIEACGYDKVLNSSQVLTVFAPTNSSFSEDDAKDIISRFKSQYGRVSDEENTALKEFIRNHIALYNYSVSSSSNDYIRLMNGKKVALTANSIHGKTFAENGKNLQYKNGLLFVMDEVLDYFPNVFEYFRKDADLDSVRNFLYSGDTLISDRAYPLFYERKFQPSLSVPGEIVDGKTVYLDSVFAQTNKLYNYLGYINSEDSTYWMVAPTNELWTQLVDEYKDYFNYENNVGRLLSVGDRDSLIYTNTRLAILEGTTFSRTLNTDKSINDSVLSVSAVERYTWRQSIWGADSLCYYQYFKPFEAGGVFDGTENVECSNGQVMKASTWNFDKQQTFFQQRILQCDTYLKDVAKVINPDTNDSIPIVSQTRMTVTSDNPYYDKVSGHSYMKFDATQALNPDVTFYIPKVLSNIGYDIYLVTVPAKAGNMSAQPKECLPTRLRCTLYYHDQNGKTLNKQLVSQVETNPDDVEYVLLASDFKFPVSSWGLDENSNTAQVTLKVETRVSATQLRDDVYTRTMNLDCIILKPHVENIDNER